MTHDPLRPFDPHPTKRKIPTLHDYFFTILGLTFLFER